MEEHELIDGLKENRQEAFRFLVKRYQEMVVSTCYHFLIDRDEAHDIAQEVFIEVYRSIHRFRQDSALSTWLYRIAVNKSINHLRKQRKQKLFIPFENLFVSGKAKHDIAEPDFTKPKEKEAAHTERIKRLHSAIDNLPTNQKTALTLHKFNNLAYKEVAEIMEISLSAVESLIHRAKKNLQSTLVKLIED